MKVDIKIKILKLTEEVKKVLFYRILEFVRHGKTQEAHTKIINSKYQLQHGIINLNYQMDRILYQIFKIILSIF